MNGNQDYFEIDLLKLGLAILKKWWLIVLSSVLGVVLAVAITAGFMTPMYSSEILMYVNNGSVNIGSQIASITGVDITTSRTLVSTYIVILKARTTLEEVAERAGVNYSAEQLSGMISSSAVNNTEVCRVVVTSPDPNEACVIANTIANVLPERISNILEGSSARIVDTAVVRPAPISPSYTKNAAIGLLAGLVVSIAIAVGLFLADDRLEGEEMILDMFDSSIPILAVVPVSGGSKGSKYKRLYYKDYTRYGYYSSGKKAQ